MSAGADEEASSSGDDVGNDEGIGAASVGDGVGGGPKAGASGVGEGVGDGVGVLAFEILGSTP